MLSILLGFGFFCTRFWSLKHSVRSLLLHTMYYNIPFFSLDVG